MILARSVPVGEILDVDALAREMGVEGERIYYALTKLSTDGLVVHEADKGYMARPLHARLAEDAIQARSLIQVAVARTVAGSIETTTLPSSARTPRLPSRACASTHPISARSPRPGAPFTRSSSGSPATRSSSTSTGGLVSDAIWLRALRHQETPRFLNPDYLVALVDALEAGDVERSCDLLLSHAIEARDVARRAIEAAGGNI